MGSSHPVHKASTPGITCLDLPVSAQHQHLVVTGGADSNVIVFNHHTGKVHIALD